MEKSVISSVLDIAYADLKNIGDIVSKEYKENVLDASRSLKHAIDVSDAVNPAPHAPYKHTEGSDTQKEIAYRKVKDIGDKIASTLDHLEGEMREALEDTLVSLDVILRKEKNRKDKISAEIEKREALKNAPKETPAPAPQMPETPPVVNEIKPEPETPETPETPVNVAENTPSTDEVNVPATEDKKEEGTANGNPAAEEEVK